MNTKAREVILVTTKTKGRDMKKLALTSLLAVFMASGANAANVIDGNPLYMPAAGHFYSVSDLSSHSKTTEDWNFDEEFGYGVTNQLAINVKTSFSEAESFDTYGWNDFSLAGAFRAVDNGNLKIDLIGSYGVDHVYPYKAPFLAEEATNYTWVAGVRGGIVDSQFTIAGHIEYVYENAESFNWGDDGLHKWVAGIDGQFVIDPSWNLVAGAEYTGITNDGAKNAGKWDVYFGVNYNIDATKFIGAYLSNSIDHHGGDAGDEWQILDGFGFGAKFGIDF